MIRELQRGLPAFLIATTLVAIYVFVSPRSTDDWVINPLTGLTAVAFCGIVVARLAVGVPNRTAKRIWVSLGLVISTVALSQFIEPYGDDLQRTFGIDDVADCVLLIVSPVTLWMIHKFDPPPLFARGLFFMGFVVQAVSTIFDILNAGLEQHLNLDVKLIDILTDFGQFAALQLYFAGVAAFLISLHFFRLAQRDGVHKIGALARHLTIRLRLHRQTEMAVFHPGWFGLKLFDWLYHFVSCFPLLAPEVARRQGPGYWHQFIDIVALGCANGLDARSYYRFGLYQPERRGNADLILTEYDTADGLMDACDRLRRQRPTGTKGDRLEFYRHCVSARLPIMPVLMLIEDGCLDYDAFAAPDGQRSALNQDLVVRPRYVDHEERSDFYRYRGDGSYEINGNIHQKGALLRRLCSESILEPLIVQQRLRNHPALADLACQSLAKVRVLSVAQFGSDEVTVTHAMLKIQCQFEPDWPSDMTLGIGINVQSGDLGLLTGDEDYMLISHLTHHPATGAALAGRQMPQWCEIKALAETAHRVFLDRAMVVWDIACTDQGLYIIDHDAAPDLDFLQAASCQPVGQTPLGAHLHAYMQALQQVNQAGDPLRP